MYCSWIQCRVWDHFESNPMLVFIKYDHLRTSSFCFVTVVVPYHGIGFRDWCSDLGHRNWGYYPLPFNRPNSRAESWNFSQVPILHLFLSLFDMLFMTGGGFRNWMFPLWFALLGGSLVFLDVGPSILFIVSPPPSLFWVLWFIYDWHGFINSAPMLASFRVPAWTSVVGSKGQVY